MHIFRNKKRDEGASLVEFAMLMPLLVLLLFGIIEFAWVFASNLDVKQGAREGARITAVDEPGGNAALRTEICSRMDLVGGNSGTTITWLADDVTPAVGEGVKVTVTTPLNTLTGLLDWVFNSVTTLESTVEIRIEQAPTWTSQTLSCP